MADVASISGMKEKINPGVLPGFANLTHPKIFTAAELESYMDTVLRLQRFRHVRPFVCINLCSRDSFRSFTGGVCDSQ